MKYLQEWESTNDEMKYFQEWESTYEMIVIVIGKKNKNETDLIKWYNVWGWQRKKDQLLLQSVFMRFEILYHAKLQKAAFW